MRRKPSHMPTGRLQSLRLFSTLLSITLTIHTRTALGRVHRPDLAPSILRAPTALL
jgi:hypothetical protein